LAQGIQLAINRGRAADVVLRIELRREGFAIVVGEAEMGCGFRELVDEVSEVGLVEIHVFVDVG
jgi:hypothetical protein